MEYKLKGHKGGWVGQTKLMYLLGDIPQYSKLDSYLVCSEGFVYSGKGGNFKRLNVNLDNWYLLSYSIPFSKSKQVYVQQEGLLDEIISLGLVPVKVSIY